MSCADEGIQEWVHIYAKHLVTIKSEALRNSAWISRLSRVQQILRGSLSWGFQVITASTLQTFIPQWDTKSVSGSGFLTNRIKPQHRALPTWAPFQGSRDSQDPSTCRSHTVPKRKGWEETAGLYPVFSNQASTRFISPRHWNHLHTPGKEGAPRRDPPTYPSPQG